MNNSIEINNEIKLSDINDGYICIHGASTDNIKTTVFVVTIMGHQLIHTINAINSQPLDNSFYVHFIKNVCPTSKAYNEMHVRCNTKYFIQCDEDMIIFPNMIEYMTNKIEHRLKKKTHTYLLCFKLKDDLLGIGKSRWLYGIKIFNGEIMKSVSTDDNKDGISSVDRELNLRMLNMGYVYDTIPEIVGYHAKYRDEFETYIKYCKMTNSLLLDNVEYSKIDLMRIYNVLKYISINDSLYYIKLYEVIFRKNLFGKRKNVINILSDFMERIKNIPNGAIEKYGYVKDIIPDYSNIDIKHDQVQNNYDTNLLVAFFGILNSIINGFYYNAEKYPYSEFYMTKKLLNNDSKGILWVKTTSDGRGYFPHFEKFLKRITTFTGDGLNNEHIPKNSINFTVINNRLCYKNSPVDIENYDMIVFIYCPELLTTVTYNKLNEIDDWIRTNTNLTIMNTIKDCSIACDKLLFYNTMKENNIAVPEYVIVESEEDLENIEYDYPYILRISNCTNTYIINNKEESKNYYRKLQLIKESNDDDCAFLFNRKIMAIKNHSSYIKELDCNLNCRVVMINDEIITFSCDPFNKSCWTCQQKDPLIQTDGKNNVLNKNKFEHIKNITNSDNHDVNTKYFEKCTSYLQEYIKDNIHMFRRARSTMKLNTVCIDFLINNENIIFVGCNLKMGLSPHNIKQFMEYTRQEIIPIYHEYYDDITRNLTIYNALCNYPKLNLCCNIECVINTIKLPIEHAVESLTKLSEKYNIHFVTTGDSSPAKLTINWLMKHKFPTKKVYFIESLEHMLETFKTLDCDIFVDYLTENHMLEHTIHRTDIINSFEEYGVQFISFDCNTWTDITKKLLL